MKFATLFLIASAVLAMPTGEKADTNVELAKKEAASAGGFRFPTEDEDDPKSENYRFRTDDGTVPGTYKPQQNQDAKKDGYKNSKDNSGKLCSEYSNKQMQDIPEECMKPLFCKFGPTFRFDCGDYSFDTDNWTKEKLINENVSGQCVAPAICKKEDVLDAPADWNGIF